MKSRVWPKRVLLVGLAALSYCVIESSYWHDIQIPEHDAYFFWPVVTVSALATGLVRFDKWKVPFWVTSGMWLGELIRSTLLSPERYNLPFSSFLIDSISAVAALGGGYAVVAIREIFFWSPPSAPELPKSDQPYR